MQSFQVIKLRRIISEYVLSSIYKILIHLLQIHFGISDKA